MTDASDETGPSPQPTEAPSPPSPVRGPISARASADADQESVRSARDAQRAGKRGRGRRGGRGGGGASHKPKSARAMARTDSPAGPVDPDEREVSFQVDDEAWVAKVLGRAGGSTGGATPLILLGFWRADAVEGDPVREVLTVGTALSRLPTFTLEQAWRSSQPFNPGGVVASSPSSSERRRH